jgi:hypothetical protein
LGMPRVSSRRGEGCLAARLLLRRRLPLGGCLGARLHRVQLGVGDCSGVVRLVRVAVGCLGTLSLNSRVVEGYLGVLNNSRAVEGCLGVLSNNSSRAVVGCSGVLNLSNSRRVGDFLGAHSLRSRVVGDCSGTLNLSNSKLEDCLGALSLSSRAEGCLEPLNLNSRSVDGILNLSNRVVDCSEALNLSSSKLEGYSEVNLGLLRVGDCLEARSRSNKLVGCSAANPLEAFLACRLGPRTFQVRLRSQVLASRRKVPNSKRSNRSIFSVSRRSSSKNPPATSSAGVTSGPQGYPAKARCSRRHRIFPCTSNKIHKQPSMH